MRYEDGKFWLDRVEWAEFTRNTIYDTDVFGLDPDEAAEGIDAPISKERT